MRDSLEIDLLGPDGEVMRWFAGTGWLLGISGRGAANAVDSGDFELYERAIFDAYAKPSGPQESKHSRDRKRSQERTRANVRRPPPRKLGAPR